MVIVVRETVHFTRMCSHIYVSTCIAWLFNDLRYVSDFLLSTFVFRLQIIYELVFYKKKKKNFDFGVPDWRRSLHVGRGKNLLYDMRTRWYTAVGF